MVVPALAAVVVLPRFRVQADLERDVVGEVTFALSVEGGEPVTVTMGERP